jgi:putative FmdB family regulatory protein
MPTYEYQCKSCNHRFEIWQKMADDALTVCPECSGTIRRVLYPAGIVFKGSGFYKTDHGTGAVLNKNEAEAADDKNKKSDEKSKTEQTSETKSSGETASSEASGGEKKSSSPGKSSEKVSTAAD